MMPTVEHHHRFLSPYALRTCMRTRVIGLSFSLFISFSIKGFGGNSFSFFFLFLSKALNFGGNGRIYASLYYADYQHVLVENLVETPSGILVETPPNFGRKCNNVSRLYYADYQHVLVENLVETPPNFGRKCNNVSRLYYADYQHVLVENLVETPSECAILYDNLLKIRVCRVSWKPPFACSCRAPLHISALSRVHDVRAALRRYRCPSPNQAS